MESGEVSEEDSDGLGGSLGRLLRRVSEVPRVSPPPRAPGRLGPYRLERVLGRGGMGVVYDAVHEERRERVALKVVSKAIDADPEARLLREWRALAEVQHPRVVRVRGAGTAEGRFYIAMEFVDGDPLAAVIADAPKADRLRWFRELCGAVAAAHAAGLVHRDLKPSNVLVERESRSVCVLDFGLAKPIERRGASDWSTNVSLVLGTPYYMPPEARSRSRPDPRVDVYALGLLGLQLVADVRPEEPHRGLVPEERARARKQLGRDADAWLDVLERACAPEAERRFADAAELGGALESLWSDRSRGWFWGVAALVAAGLGFALVRWWAG